MTGVGLVFVLAGVILFIAGLCQMAQNKAFTDAQLVTGLVIDKRTRQLKNGTAHELTVTYTVNGVEYNKVVGVKLSVYNRIAEGGSFDLKYRPDKPYKAINPDVLNPKKARSVMIFGAVMTVVGAALLLVGRFL